MQIQRLALDAALGHLLLHNVVDDAGRRILRKGVRIGEEQVAQLQALGWQEVEVAVLDQSDVWEDDAASQLAYALQNDALDIAWGVGGRANFHANVSGVLVVDVRHLHSINLLPGLALATLPQFSVVHPRFGGENQRDRHGDQVATLKVIPYAVPSVVVDKAVTIAHSTPILKIQPFLFHRIALLIVGEESTYRRLQIQFEQPIRVRVEKLNSVLEEVAFAMQDEAHIALQTEQLLRNYDALIVAGQTSIMDLEDQTLRGLRLAGVTDLVHGAPVDPGNLLAIGFSGKKMVLCAPGCARSLKQNVVDLVLPRLLTGEKLGREEIANLAVGGLLYE